MYVLSLTAKLRTGTSMKSGAFGNWHHDGVLTMYGCQLHCHWKGTDSRYWCSHQVMVLKFDAFKSIQGGQSAVSTTDTADILLAWQHFGRMGST